MLRPRYIGGITDFGGLRGGSTQKCQMSDLQRKPPVFSQQEQQDTTLTDLTVCTQLHSSLQFTSKGKGHPITGQGGRGIALLILDLDARGGG
jgi:hypothetical protein